MPISDYDVRSKWYPALSREDSLRVMALLEEHPTLLKEGWGSAASEFQGNAQPWKGRTALHVGVKRGCVALVEQILILCEVVIRKSSRVGDQEGGDSALTNRRDQSEVARDRHDEDDGLFTTENEDDGLTPSKNEVNRPTATDGEDEKRKFLCRLLKFKDEEYSLDAIAIALLHGNREILLLLMYAMGKCNLHQVRTDRLPALDAAYDVGIDDIKDLTIVDTYNPADEARMAKLREVEAQRASQSATLSEITKGVVDNYAIDGKLLGALLLKKYETHRDFNFLPWPEYLFHYLVTLLGREDRVAQVANAFLRELCRKSLSVWRFLLELRDGQGRTPLHVAADEGCTEQFFAGLRSFSTPSGDAEECAILAPDGVGRTAIETAIAIGQDSITLWIRWSMLKKRTMRQHPIPYVVDMWSPDNVVVEESLFENGFECEHNISVNYEFHRRKRFVLIRSNPLSTAIIHKQAYTVDHLVHPEWRVPRHPGWLARSIFEMKSRERTRMVDDLNLKCLHNFGTERLSSGRWRDRRVDTVELAALVGDASVSKLLPSAKYLPSSFDWRNSFYRPWPALHIAANFGNYEMVKLFLEDPHGDPYEEDWEGNSALHHALRVITIPEFQPTLLHFVNCKHVHARDPRQKENNQIVDPRKKKTKIAGDDPLIDRQACINLLLEAGCDIFKTNNEGQSPYPKGELSENAKFRSWWYEKQGKEFDSTQTTLRSAASAISVVATLVATASYVGPLQPPMGTAGNPSQMQYANFWVRVFIFGDTMSFYLAIIAIIFSLIPSLPMYQQSMVDEVQRTQGMVTMSVAILFPSVIFVLIAFISSSIAVVSSNVISTGGELTIITASIGGFLCPITFLIFFVKLLAFICPKSKPIRKIYHAIDKLLIFRSRARLHIHRRPFFLMGHTTQFLQGRSLFL